MFGGEQGRKLVDETLPQLEASTTMAGEQQALLRDLLQSVQKFYDQPAVRHAAAHRRRAASRCRTPCARRR